MSSFDQPIAKHSKPSLPSLQELSSPPTPSGRAPNIKSASQPSAPEVPRRSKREHRRSARQIESGKFIRTQYFYHRADLEPDEYQSTLQASTRPSTPSTSDSEPKPKQKPKKSKPKKSKSSKRGDWPGRIVQPAANTGTMSYRGSPEPFTAPQSQQSNSVLASQGSVGSKVEVIRREEGIRRVSKHLGANLSHASNKTLKKVLEEMPYINKEVDAGPMEPERGSAPAVLQSTGRVVLESRHELPTTTTANDIRAPQDSSTRLASGAIALNQSRPGEPINEDLATEPESEPEFIELRPEDSVSQHPPLSQPQHTFPIPIPPTAARPSSIHKAKQLNPLPADSDGTTTEDKLDASDSDCDVCASKRQRLTQPPWVAHSPHVRTSHAITQPNTITITRPVHPAKSSDGITWLSMHSRPVKAAPLAAPTRARASIVAPGSSSTSPPSSSMSDLDYVLAWMTQLAKQAGISRPDIVDGAFDRLCSRLDVAVPKSRQPVPQSLKRPHDTNLIEDDAEILNAQAALKRGVHARRRQKPVLTDFPGHPHYIATRAIPELFAVACTRGMWEMYGTVIDWANKCYERIWGIELPDVRLQKAPYELKGIIAHQLSWYWGERRGEDPKTGTNPYKHPAVSEFIGAMLFSGPNATAVLYRERFSPMPLPAVAMILTFMQQGLREWKTGRYVPITLKASKQQKMYKAHLQGLPVYAETAAARLHNFQRDWYKYDM
ncbi:hypothetical protein FRC07_004204 [Ceratobasidium sp. 392]|nr:hypothetical protein FRC07_004204 [Ceratobasidium sp. 392]